MPADPLDKRLSLVERDVADLREVVTEERIAAGRLAAQVSAMATTSSERHAEVLTAINAMREDMQLRDARAQKVVIGIIGVLSTAITALGSGLVK